MFIRLSVFSVLFTLLTACGPSPAPETTAGATVTSVDKSEAPLDVSEERIMPQDQTEGTAEANPEVVDPAKLPEPQLKEKTPEAKPRQAPAVNPKPAASPAPPAKPAPKNTRTSPPPPPPAPNTEPAAAPEKEIVESEMEIPSPQPNHAPFNSLLKTYINGSGRVDYAGLKKDEARLDAYLAILAKDAPDDSWSRNEGLAYWLNAYNAYTLKLILKNYPVKSITDLHGGKPWDVKWIDIDGKTYSLNNIEHDIIRPRYEDPRIHFAVVCAAASCPPLANYAFSAGSVNTQLDKLARNFINNNKFNQTKGDVKVSKIFDWYAEDFGDVRAYLNKYLASDIPEGAAIGYADYDWALNKQ
jgi:hypothetical protein